VKVILSQNVPNLGEIGAEVNVSRGYARNFLFPRRLAVQLDSASAQQIEHEKRIIAKRETENGKEMEGVAAGMKGAKIEITARAGDGGKLFGSVTTANIAAALNDLGHVVDRRAVKLESPIKSLGSYEVAVRLAKDVETIVVVDVNAEELEETPEESTELLEAAIAEVDAEEEAEQAPAAEKAPEASEEATTEDAPEADETAG